MGSKTAKNSVRMDLYAAEPYDFVIIGHDTKHKAGEHPLYDTERLPLLKKLTTASPEVRNAAKMGIKEPVIVRRDGDKLLVVDGRNRVVRARLANELLRSEGAPELRVKYIVDSSPEAELLGIMFALNAVRTDDSPVARIRNIAAYCNQGRTPREAADIFKTDVREISNALRVVTGHAALLAALEAGELSLSHAYVVARLPSDAQPEVVRQVLAARMTVAETIALVRGMVADSDDEGDDEDDDGESEGDGEGGGKRSKKAKKAPAAPERTGKRPALGEIKKLLKYLEEHADDIDIGQHNLLRWFAGEVGPRQVTGLSPLLRKAGVIPE